jgi:hypothetical protein
MPTAYDPPLVRPLKVYAFDPTRGRTITNLMTIDVAYERLEPGPAGRYLEVIDYDASNDCFYEPVDLENPDVLIGDGLSPRESDPRFHQQMVYAVASETIRRFERALGRRIRWRRRHGRGADPQQGRLRIFPHAMQEANAFYDPDIRALVFGYFEASHQDPGVNVPGQVVFTCLSHDIVAHETTHALIDGLREHFSEPTSVDTPAFHEAFADIVALFQHFSMREPVLETIRRTGGLIHKTQLAPEVTPGPAGPTIQSELTVDNPLVDLARQFGEAMGMRAALRSALGTRPNTDDLRKYTEPHARGSVLVAAVFDAYFTVYLRRTRDLMQIAQAGALTWPGDINPDLADRLSKEALKAADHFSDICIRSLDFCPPVDIQFGDFLRALITADADLVHDDPYGYRAALIDAFRSRGIIPENVGSFSEESLYWPPPLLRGHRYPQCTDLSFDVMAPPATQAQLGERARILQRFANRNARALHLAPRVPIQSYSFRHIHRVGPDGRVHFGLAVEFLQQRRVALFPDEPRLGTFTFRGGTTVLFDQQGFVRYAIAKRVDDEERLQRQREFHQMAGTLGAAAYVTAPRRAAPSFAAIHRGY